MNDDVMYMSPSGGSGIKISLILECEKKFYYRHVEKWIQKKVGKALAFGILFHQAFQLHNFDVFEAQWRSGILEPKEIPEDRPEIEEGKEIERYEKDIKKDLRIAKRMYERVLEEDLRPVKQESFIAATPMDPETGDTPECLENIIVCGTRDMIEDYKGRHILSDLKTARGRWSDKDALGSMQLQTYRYAEACANEDIHDEGSFIVVTKHKKEPILERFHVKMNDDDHFAVYDTLYAAGSAIKRCSESGCYRRNTANCKGMFGDLCPYHPFCFPHRYEDPEEVINEKLVCVG